ncbi:activator of 2-hydroxyglutaryl-CoA dehydratase (HSP70-class ATPase domain)-like protein [Candidatus Gastranaerophilus sp. (ex Termes propinquus)]|nr:activator of 2-hydroxyglutaryl-CoA dehydratase (HSP70-class ATPase domain)-like protein [Candidatus Gastranaerophilus sp. (ex Termes propinquus)]
MKSRFFLDAGTTWSKMLEVREGAQDIYRVFPTSSVPEGLEFEKTTGHRARTLNTREHVNEIVALATGAQERIGANDIVIDLGSRDVKWVKFKDGKFSDMDWNTACGSSTGATVEMLLKFYNVKAGELKAVNEKYSVTCGIFALEKIMDDVSKGTRPAVAISKFVHGLAFNAWNFTKNPKNLFISGGFCENKCFMDSLNKYCEATPLGRFTLVYGLAADLSTQQNPTFNIQAR